MWSEQSSPMFLGVIVMSIVAHVVLLAVLPPADAMPDAPRPKTLVTFETPPLPPPPLPAPAVESQPIPETTATRAPRTRPAARKAAPAPQVASAEPPAATPEAPVDFSGMTLSNEGASWSSPTGNGEPMTGPIAAADATVKRGPVVRASAQPSYDRVVAVGDLSRAPKAPDLDSALAANYPADARRAGTTGKAVVRARILANGSVGSIRVVSESAPGFGVACKRTLAGSRWQPPLDANSTAVITDINYSCTFAVTR